MVGKVENMILAQNVECRTCMLSKIHQQPILAATANRTTELLYVCGPFPTQSLAGSKYFLTFIEDKSRRIFVYFLRKIDEVLSKFMEFWLNGRQIESLKN